MTETLVRPNPERAALAPPGAAAETVHVSRQAAKALETLYRVERRDLLRFLRRRVGPDLAPDIAQEVFLKAATSRQITELANPGGFLHRIACNVLIDRARRKDARTTALPLVEGADAPCPATQGHRLEALDLKRSLERALSELPERTRTIFILHRFEAMAYRDIGRELDISLSAVEYHMMKALAHVRTALAAL